jgi:hypothetical protein
MHGGVLKRPVVKQAGKRPGHPILETSAKDSNNVSEAFMTMASEIQNRLTNQPVAGQDEQRQRRWQHLHRHRAAPAAEVTVAS